MHILKQPWVSLRVLGNYTSMSGSTKKRFFKVELSWFTLFKTRMVKLLDLTWNYSLNPDSEATHACVTLIQKGHSLTEFLFLKS